ncbi:MAG TPA: hypothetical protein VJR05_13320 [Acidimicrobiia bacterium]|nr:hypothetical protein [Acidimicrobiia bacterium]
MKTEEQVVALFAAANPIPHLDLVEPPEPFDPLFLEGFNRGSEVGVVWRSPQSLNRGKRWRVRPVVAAVLALALLALGVLLAARLLGPDVPNVVDEPPADLGVFEPIRGWIVYNAGKDLEALNPADPSQRRILEFPEESRFYTPNGDGNSRPIPAGWSNDGTVLGIHDEYNGASYVLDSSGAVSRLPGESGCCWFVSSDWLSPDGTSYARGAEGEGLEIVDIDDPGSSRTFIIEEDLGPPGPAWSPDGSAIAFVTQHDAGCKQSQGQPCFWATSVEVMSVDTGERRVLPGDFGHVRHVSWSPDGTELLILAGETQVPTGRQGLNPYLTISTTDLYVASADGSGLRAITSASATKTNFMGGTWSPDGTMLAVINSSRTIIVMNTDGSERRVLYQVRRGSVFIGIAWHPVP